MGEEKELALEYLKADINSKKKEVENLIKSIKEHEDILTYMKDVAEMFGEGIDKYTTPEMVRKLEPTFRFEQEDGYWELQSRLMRLEQNRKYFIMKDMEIPKLERTINEKKKGLVELQELIKKMEGDME